MAGSTTFHRAEIGGVTFEAHLSVDGPYINAIYDRDRHKGVALGACTSVADLPEDHDGPAGLFVVKYGSQKRIHLEGFGPADIARFKAEFGVGTGNSGGREFYGSRAAQGLIGYVRSHPRIAKRFADATSYLGDWYGWAVENVPGAAASPGVH